jgi:hypothetical protein
MTVPPPTPIDSSIAALIKSTRIEDGMIVVSADSWQHQQKERSSDSYHQRGAEAQVEL